MRVLTPANSFPEKINFIDDNNVLVGFDMQGQCCEDFGWYISEEKKTEPNQKDGIQDLEQKNVLIKDYSFDPNFFEEIDAVVRFKLIDDKNNELYLHLFNFHNGYYSHGFSVEIPGKQVIQGSI